MGRRVTAKVTVLEQPEPDRVQAAWVLYREGRPALAAEALLPVLLAEAGSGETAVALAACLLQHDLHVRLKADPRAPLPVDEDLMAHLVDRLVALVRRQDAQIAALLAVAE